MGICTFENENKKIYIVVVYSHALNAECGYSTVHKESSGSLRYWHIFPKSICMSMCILTVTNYST